MHSPAPEAALIAEPASLHLTVPSPVGPLALTEREGAIVALSWGEVGIAGAVRPTPLLARAATQLAAYFDGRLRAFDLPLAPDGTALETRIWNALRAIPCGTTVTYGALAERLATGPRAVGRACGANPIPILIPCPRVVAADGGLRGYSGAGGLATKAALLRLEGAAVSG